MAVSVYVTLTISLKNQKNALARLRISHTRSTHFYLLLGEEQFQCVGCNQPFTVCHVLLKYVGNYSNSFMLIPLNFTGF